MMRYLIVVGAIILVSLGRSYGAVATVVPCIGLSCHPADPMGPCVPDRSPGMTCSCADRGKVDGLGGGAICVKAPATFAACSMASGNCPCCVTFQYGGCDYSPCIVSPTTTTTGTTTTGTTTTGTTGTTTTGGASPCPGKVCGKVTSEETGIALPGIYISLVDQMGKMIAQTRTDASGAFAFGASAGVVLGGSYNIRPVAPRNVSVIPLMTHVDSLDTATGWSTAFALQGITGTLVVQGCPDNTYVLITTFTYNAPYPPDLGPASNTTVYTETSFAGAARIEAEAQRPSDPFYQATFWKPVYHGVMTSPVRAPVAGSNAFTSLLTPNDQITMGCP